MKLQKLAILLIVTASLVPAYFINRYLRKAMRPKESFGRMLLYMCVMLVIVFAFTFGVTLLIRNLFAPPSR